MPPVKHIEGLMSIRDGTFQELDFCVNLSSREEDRSEVRDAHHDAAAEFCDIPVGGRLAAFSTGDELDPAILSAVSNVISGLHNVARGVPPRVHNVPPPEAGVIGTVPGGGGLAPKPPLLSGTGTQKQRQL